jgi:hypothetical protein
VRMAASSACRLRRSDPDLSKIFSLVAACLLCFGFVLVAAADQESLWTYNDSEMYLVTKGQVSDFATKNPAGL